MRGRERGRRRRSFIGIPTLGEELVYKIVVEGNSFPVHSLA
jgi:hypothetical protein